MSGACVVVVGVPGVGKTTVIKGLEELCRSKGIEVKVVNFGTVMLTYLSQRFPSLHRDQIRRLPLSVQRDAQLAAAEAISREAEGVDLLLVDTHSIVRTKQGYLPGLPPDVLRKLNPSLLVVVEARPEDVARRRFKDPDRLRDSLAIHELAREIEVSRSFAAHAAATLGIPLLVLENVEGHPKVASERLFEAVVDLVRGAT